VVVIWVDMLNIDVEPFGKKWNLTPFMIAPTAIIKGLGMTLGIEQIEVEGATGDYHTNFDQKASKAII
jgi:2,3-bisphosphoglycerate-independent phosphoglycerate mutase